MSQINPEVHPFENQVRIPQCRQSDVAAWTKLIRENGNKLPRSAILYLFGDNSYTAAPEDFAFLQAAKNLRLGKELSYICIRCPNPVPKALIAFWQAFLSKALVHGATDYLIAHAAHHAKDKWNIKGSEFAANVGLSAGYVYNLIRWYDRLPQRILTAWKNQSPLITQVDLQAYSNRSQEEATFH